MNRFSKRIVALVILLNTGLGAVLFAFLRVGNSQPPDSGGSHSQPGNCGCWPESEGKAKRKVKR